MIEKINILLLLLVIGSMEFAHANTWKQIKNDTTVQTSSISNTKNIENSLNKGDKIYKKIKNSIQEDSVGNIKPKKDLQGKFSVVQDWNLVCKQLCGAGLGGPSCGQPQCEDIKNSQTENTTLKAQKLLKSKENLICGDLCKYGLGGDICTCELKIFSVSLNQAPSLMWYRNQVCYTFCLHNDITLIGCSLCTKIIPTISGTTQSPAVIKKTTPNWKEICDVLCKTGDGGSLCNCDKPPFF